MAKILRDNFEKRRYFSGAWKNNL